MSEFDPAPGAAVVPPDDEFAPAADAPITAPEAAPAAAPAAPRSLLSRVASQVAQPFKDIGHGLYEANKAVTGAIFHPVDTFNAIRANPLANAREAMRGVNDNIPFANRAVEAIGGPAADSPEDAAAAIPGARAVGNLAAAPFAGEMLGGIAAKVASKAAPLVARAAESVGDSAAARQVARTKEALELKVNKRTRAGLKSDAVDAAISDSPELRKAAGNDAAVAEVTAGIQKRAADTLDQIYTESPAARERAASDLRELEGKAKEARARADALEAGAPAAPAGQAHPLSGVPQTANPETAAAFWKGHPNADANPLSLPDVRPTPAIESPEAAASWSPRALAVDEAKAEAAQLEQQVAERRSASGPSSAPRVESSAPLAAIDKRISALKGTKLPKDAAAASSLEKIRGKLAESIGEDGALDPRRLRQIQSDYQREGYAKNINDDPDVSARIRANREASKAVGDVVVEHVTGMDYQAAKAAAAADPSSFAAKLFKANDQINAANKIEAGIADRAGRVQPAHGPAAVVKRIAGHAFAPLVVGGTHGVTAGLATAAGQELLHAAPGVARAGASLADRAIAATAPRVASAARGIGEAAAGGTPLQRVQAMAAAGNPRAAKLLANLRGAGAPGTPSVGTATSGTLAATQ